MNDLSTIPLAFLIFRIDARKKIDLKILPPDLQKQDKAEQTPHMW
jgi:hypothetical protein